MLKIRAMEVSDRDEVMKMEHEFYHSDAVDHIVGEEILLRTFTDAVGEEPNIWGVILCEEEEVIGFSYLTSCYGCEVGGKVIILEELFMKEQARGKGYGKKFFQWLFDTYRREAVRFRLEVTKANMGAAALYKKMGFEFLEYSQMIQDL
jgi:GNAT superfamily N-acetyltransferase